MSHSTEPVTTDLDVAERHSPVPPSHATVIASTPLTIGLAWKIGISAVLICGGIFGWGVIYNRIVDGQARLAAQLVDQAKALEALNGVTPDVVRRVAALETKQAAADTTAMRLERKLDVAVLNSQLACTSVGAHGCLALPVDR